VSSSKEIVCCQLQTRCFSENKNTKKLIKNTRKCCLWHTTKVRVSNFKIALCAIFFFYAPNQKKCPIFARKPACGEDMWVVRGCGFGIMRLTMYHLITCEKVTPAQQPSQSCRLRGFVHLTCQAACIRVVPHFIIASFTQNVTQPQGQRWVKQKWQY